MALGGYFACLAAGLEEAGVQLVINGEPRAGLNAPDIAALVAELGLDPRKVAVERNLEIVPRSLYAATGRAEGDRIELVQFVGGG